MRRACSAPSPPPQTRPVQVKAPRVQTAGEDSVRADRQRRRRGRRQLRVGLNLGGVPGVEGAAAGQGLTIGG